VLIAFLITVQKKSFHFENLRKKVKQVFSFIKMNKNMEFSISVQEI